MRQIILRQNVFLKEMAIVPINFILQNNKLKEMNCFKQLTNYTAIRSTRKYFEGRWILVTTNKKTYTMQ